MTPIRQREQIARELAGLQSLLHETPDDPFSKPLLESRIRTLQDELLSEETVPFVPETELLFSGKAVFGSIGIDAKFAGHVLHSYQDMLNTHYAAKRHGHVGKQGRLRGEKEARLYLTGLPRGSFGFVLAQPHSDDLFSASQVNESMEQLASLLEASALGDDNFAETVANFHPRVLKSLGRFLYCLSLQDASVTIRAGRKQTSLSLNQIHEAHTRAVSAKAERKVETIDGVFKGVLLESWRFDFLPEKGPLITGLIAEDVTDEQAKEMNEFFDKPATAELMSSYVVTRSGASRPTYVLKNLTPR
jgi:hypothetical protein